MSGCSTRARRPRIATACEFLEKRLVEETSTRGARRAQGAHFESGLRTGLGGAAVPGSMSQLSNFAEFTLLDFNEETLQTRGRKRSAKSSSSTGAPLRFESGEKSVQQLLKDVVRADGIARGNDDFIYCAGLFDYLPDRTCKRLMTLFYQSLAPGGLVLATNVAPLCPNRGSLELILDWHLIYRDAAKVAALRPEGVPEDEVRIESDDTGVNVFLEMRKPMAAEQQSLKQAEFREAFLANEQQVRINSGKLACALVFFLMPFGVILDYFVYPDHLVEFLNFGFCAQRSLRGSGCYITPRSRGSATRSWGCRSLFCRRFSSRGWFTELLIRQQWIMTTHDEMRRLTTPGLNSNHARRQRRWPLEHAGDFPGCACLVSSHVPWWRVSARAAHPSQMGIFFTNFYFLVLTGIIVLCGNYLFNRLRFREFVLRYELDKNRKALEESNQKLMELDQIKSRFFANISHELRTPLTLLLAPLETLLQRFNRSLDEETRDMLLTMHSNGMRLLKLINDLLDLVRLESGRMEVKHEPLEVAEFVKGLASAARQVADDKRLRLETFVDPAAGHGAGGPRQAGEDRSEPGVQRAEVHARRRPRRIARGKARRRIRADGGRHRHGHFGKEPAARFRPLLAGGRLFQAQIPGRRHRPGAGQGIGGNPGRQSRRPKPGRQRHHVHRAPAVSEGRAGAKRRKPEADAADRPTEPTAARSLPRNGSRICTAARNCSRP